MRLAGNEEIGFTITLSQRNVRELYHMMQLANAQAIDGKVGEVPMLFKALGTKELLVVQVETDESHYAGEFPDAIALEPESAEMLDGKVVLTITPPWDDEDAGDQEAEKALILHLEEDDDNEDVAGFVVKSLNEAAEALLALVRDDDADADVSIRIAKVEVQPPWKDKETT